MVTLDGLGEKRTSRSLAGKKALLTSWKILLLEFRRLVCREFDRYFEHDCSLCLPDYFQQCGRIKYKIVKIFVKLSSRHNRR